MKSNRAKNEAAIKRIVRSVGRYNLCINQFKCRANSETMAFEYHIQASRRSSGTRGGHIRNRRYWVLDNLWPEQRAIIEALPRAKA
jgi:hypothetical protein